MRTPTYRRWKWSRQPRPRKGREVLAEIRPALVHVDYASSRLAMHVSRGDEVLDAIDYARRQLGYAERAVYQVDPELRVARDDDAPMV